MSENHREPEVPKVKVRVVECLDGPARITLEELAITHFVQNGTLQNACSTRPRVVVGFGKSAHSHIVRLMNSQRKRSEKNGDKSAVAMLKKKEHHQTKNRATCFGCLLIKYMTIGLRISGHDAAEVSSPEGH